MALKEYLTTKSNFRIISRTKRLNIEEILIKRGINLQSVNKKKFTANDLSLFEKLKEESLLEEDAKEIFRLLKIDYNEEIKQALKLQHIVEIEESVLEENNIYTLSERHPFLLVARGKDGWLGCKFGTSDRQDEQLLVKGVRLNQDIPEKQRELYYNKKGLDVRNGKYIKRTASTVDFGSNGDKSPIEIHTLNQQGELIKKSYFYIDVVHFIPDDKVDNFLYRKPYSLRFEKEQSICGKLFQKSDISEKNIYHFGIKDFIEINQIGEIELIEDISLFNSFVNEYSQNKLKSTEILNKSYNEYKEYKAFLKNKEAVDNGIAVPLIVSELDKFKWDPPKLEDVTKKPLIKSGGVNSVPAHNRNPDTE